MSSVVYHIYKVKPKEIAVIISRKYTISKSSIMDFVESNMDFSERGRSLKNGFSERG